MQPGRGADHSSPSSAPVMKEKRYTSTYPLGHTGPVTGSLYLYIYIYMCVCVCVCDRLQHTGIYSVSGASTSRHG